MSLKEKIEGNELDLSLNQLKEVPVKELASSKRATHLDLSCNLIETLPIDFPSLTHLVKIDLSKNKLIELPSDFGNLINLQYLDLYENNIVSLPVSFCRLKSLKWLDLKNNPLEKTLRNVAGDCLDEKQCQSCAKKVVAFMQSIESDLEKERQKELKIAKEKVAKERALMEEQRRLKKLEKEKRRAESRAKKEAQVPKENKLPNDSSQPTGVQNMENSSSSKTVEAPGLNCGKIFMYSFMAVSLLFLCCLGIWQFYKNYTKKDVIKMVENVNALLYYYVTEIIKFIASNSPKVKEFFLKLVHRYMSNMTYFASELERMVSLYF